MDKWEVDGRVRKTRENLGGSAFYSQEKKNSGQTAEVTLFVIIVLRL